MPKLTKPFYGKGLVSMLRDKVLAGLHMTTDYSSLIGRDHFNADLERLKAKPKH